MNRDDAYIRKKSRLIFSLDEKDLGAFGVMKLKMIAWHGYLQIPWNKIYVTHVVVVNIYTKIALSVLIWNSSHYEPFDVLLFWEGTPYISCRSKA
jgi:hypothetical protein